MTFEQFNILNVGVAGQIVAETSQGWKVTRIETFEMADGSHRWASIVTMYRGDDERAVRVVAPAPSTAPAWASRAWEVTELEGR